MRRGLWFIALLSDGLGHRFLIRVPSQIPSGSSTEINQHSPDFERRLRLSLASPKAVSPGEGIVSDTSQHKRASVLAGCKIKK